PHAGGRRIPTSPQKASARLRGPPGPSPSPAGFAAMNRTTCSTAPQPGRPTRPPPTPTFSVIVPLVEHRGPAAECLAALLRRQPWPRDDYQVLAVSDGAEPAVERAVLPLLGREDRLLREDGANRSRLYDVGARAAEGRFVFFTESHCLPEPSC